MIARIEHVLSPDNLDDMVSKGFIRRNKHPDLPLWVYNYTHKTQYEKVWNRETRACRGLVVDENGVVVARPFPKFFNWTEHTPASAVGPLPFGEDFKAYEKLDGTLIVVSNYRGVRILNTRSEFDNQFTLAAAKMLGKHIPPEGYTWCFELIGPSNRIVVQYPRDEIVLLGEIDNAFAVERMPEEVYLPFRAARRYDAADIASLIGNADDDGQFEGWVIRYGSGVRAKVKLPEYMRLHKLITQCSNITIWEALKAGDSMEEMLSRVPDEFYQYVTDTASELRSSFAAIDDRVRATVDEAREYETRKEQAAHIVVSGVNAAACFALLDGRDDYVSHIWKQVRPGHEKASVFAREGDE